MNKHIGSDFDDFLHDEGIQEAATAAALKRVIAWQLACIMKERGISQTQMAVRMHTSRMASPAIRQAKLSQHCQPLTIHNVEQLQRRAIGCPRG
jgi:hypothetical protein